MKGYLKKLSAATLSLLIACGTLPVVEASADNADTAVFTVVHTNDIHGYYKSTSSQVGFDKLKTLIDSTDAQLVLDAGDTFHGQSFATVDEGEGIAELMEYLGYDATTAGNHDFSYGSQRLAEIDSEYNFSILDCNMTDTSGDSYFENDYIVKDITAENGETVRVGILGVTDDDFQTSMVPANIADVVFDDEVESANTTAQILREEEDCDVVIAIGHLADCEEFAESTSGIDIVIAGHQHINVNEDVVNADGETVHLTEAGYYFQNVGVLTVEYDSATGEVTATTDTQSLLTTDDISESDGTVSTMISSLEESHEDILGEIIGESSAEYTYVWEEVRTSEQDIGLIVTNAYLNTTGADVAIENAGGIRGGIPAGDVTYGDVLSISPYGNYIVTVELTGAQLVNVIETSLSLAAECNAVYDLQKAAVEAGEDPYQYSWPDGSGSVLQFGGIDVEYDEDTYKVLSAKINGNEIDLTATYTVATNNYVFTDTTYSDIANADMVCEWGTCESSLIDFVGNYDFESVTGTRHFTAVSSADTATDTDTQADTDTDSDSDTDTDTATNTDSSGSSSSSVSSSTSDTASASTSSTTSTSATSTADTTAVTTSGRFMWLIIAVVLISGGTALAFKKRREE